MPRRERGNRSHVEGRFCKTRRAIVMHSDNSGGGMMKNRLGSMIVLLAFLAAPALAHARDTKYLLPITVALESKDADQKLDGNVKFFFGDQKTPAVQKKFGTY